MIGLYGIRRAARHARNAKTVLLNKPGKQKRYINSRCAELPRSKECNTAPVSRARDGKLSSKSGTSLKAVTEIDIATVTATAVRSVKSAGLTAKPAELESERITARDEAYGRPKQTDVSRPSSSSRR